MSVNGHHLIPIGAALALGRAATLDTGDMDKTVERAHVGDGLSAWK